MTHQSIGETPLQGHIRSLRERIEGLSEAPGDVTVAGILESLRDMALAVEELSVLTQDAEVRQIVRSGWRGGDC